MPRRQKYRKAFKGRIHGQATRGATIAYGRWGLQSQSAARITSRQIEAARQAMTRSVKRGGRVWIRIFPHVPVTKKGLGLRMGSGKGNPEYYIARVKPGTVMFEMDGVAEAPAREAMRLASHKLPVKCQFIAKGDF